MYQQVALGPRKINIYNKCNKKTWFADEVKILAKQKREAYPAYRCKKLPEEYEKYVRITNTINEGI